MIKLVLFDFDGVITNLNLEKTYSELTKIDMPEEEKMKIFWHAYIEFGSTKPNVYPYCEEFYKMIDNKTGKTMNRQFNEGIKEAIKKDWPIRSELKDILEQNI